MIALLDNPHQVLAVGGDLVVDRSVAILPVLYFNLATQIWGMKPLGLSSTPFISPDMCG